MTKHNIQYVAYEHDKHILETDFWLDVAGVLTEEELALVQDLIGGAKIPQIPPEIAEKLKPILRDYLFDKRLF